MTWNELMELLIRFGELLLLLGAFLWYMHTRKKEQKVLASTITPKESKTPVGSQKIPFSKIRRYSFPKFEEFDFDAYTIRKSLLQAFQLYLSLSPNVIGTVTKIQKALTEVHLELLQEDINEVSIDTWMQRVSDALDQLEGVSNTLLGEIDRLTEEIDANPLDTSEVELSPDLILAYVDIVNTIESIGTEYANLNIRLFTILHQVYNVKVKTLNQISEKLIYILFIEVVCCSNQLDKYITAYKGIKPEEVSS